MNIGIVQGRLTDSNKLQYFPKDWKKEYIISRYIGYSYIEGFLIDGSFNKKFLNNKNLNFIRKNNIQTSKLDELILCDNYSIKSNLFSKQIFKYYSNIFNKINKKFKKKKLIIPINNNYFSEPELLEKFLRKVLQNTDNLTSVSIEANFDPNKTKELFKKIDNKKLGFTFDTGNIFNSGYDLVYYFNTINDYIDHVHIKDRDKKGANVSLGSGLINFDKIFKLIKKNKKISSLTLETYRKRNSIVEAYKNLSFIKNLL